MSLPDRIASLPDLTAYLDAEHLTYARHESQHMIELATETGPVKGRMFVRWETTVPYVTVIHPIVMDIPAERLPAVTQCVTLINHAILLPGFGVDHEKRFVYFRVVIPVEPGGVEAKFFRAMVMACLANARDFWLALHGVVAGESPEGALRAALSLLGKSHLPGAPWKDN